MRIAAVAALFVAVLLLPLAVQPTTPAAGETVPPTATPCAGDCGPIPTPRPSPGSTSTPDPNCPVEGCGPIPTPRPPSGTPLPDCDGECFPWPTPRPTNVPGAPIEPAKPGPEEGYWHYSFMPIVGRR